MIDVEKISYLCPTLIIFAFIMATGFNPVATTLLLGIWVGIVTAMNALWRGMFM